MSFYSQIFYQTIQQLFLHRSQSIIYNHLQHNVHSLVNKEKKLFLLNNSVIGGFIHTHHPLAQSIPTLIPTKNTLLTYLSDISSINTSDDDLSLDDTTG